MAKAEALRGELKVQGSKNAVLPMMAAALLTCEDVVLHNCPDISDVSKMITVLKALGGKVKREKDTVIIRVDRINDIAVNESFAGDFRASILFLGALIGRTGHVRISYPGGCKIGKRPIDIHLSALEALGVKICDDDNMVSAKGHITGTEVVLRYPSVGATENIILASVCADNIVRIIGAARDPEVSSLCELLNSMGADIEGIGGHVLTIRGVRRLHGTEFQVPGDRIVAGTYALAAIATGGSIRITGLKGCDLAGQYTALSQTGAKMLFKGNTWYIESIQKPMAVRYLKTGPFPEFPTDLQSPILAAMLKAKGNCFIKETVYPDRFNIVKELKKMGADISVDKNTVLVNGVESINPGNLVATELRGAAGLVIAGLEAEGESFISGIQYLKRGYEDICRDLNCLGARVSIMDKR